MSKSVRFVPYKSKKNSKWYWKLIGKNGEKIAGGVESFNRRPSPKVLEMLIRNITTALYDFKGGKK